jgi:hypothetical protein
MREQETANLELSGETLRTLENFLLYHLEPVPTWHEPDEEELAAMRKLRKELTEVLINEQLEGERDE